MTALLVVALMLGASWAWKLHDLHVRALPGNSFFVLRLNGALQGFIGLAVGVLAGARGLGLVTGNSVLELGGQRGELLRFGASAALATSIPLVLVHLGAMFLALRWRRRPAVLALGFASGTWALGALCVAGLELGPGFFPRASGA
jgi:hypothetical protein